MLWLWLGEPSGASVRQGQVCRGLTAEPLLAHQDAAHEVRFSLGDARGEPGLRADHWHQLAIVRRAAAVAVGVDGAASPHVRGAAGPIVIGAGLQGKIDEIALFDRPLSADEITALWQAGTATAGR
ncbi:MAG: LamG domain-containing protein [Planctomycetes bacterium]|nr:LamG domain-containing protein [Planctomycetota bacterium]